MDFMFWMILGAFLWVMLALWPAFMAKRKGYSFWLFVLLGVVTSFLVALIVAFIVKDKNKTAQDRSDKKAVDAVFENQK